MCGRMIPVQCWKINNLQYVEVFPMRWLSMRNGDNEESRLYLLDWLSFLHKGRNHLISSWLSYCQCLPIFRLTEDPSIDDCHALVRDHIAMHIDIITLHLQYNSDKLWDIKTHGVLILSLLLESGSALNFFGIKEGLLVYLSKHLSHQLKSQRLSNQVRLISVLIIQFNEASHLGNLGWIIDGFDIDSDSLGVVGVLRVIAKQIGTSLL